VQNFDKTKSTIIIIIIIIIIITVIFKGKKTTVTNKRVNTRKTAREA